MRTRELLAPYFEQYRNGELRKKDLMELTGKSEYAVSNALRDAGVKKRKHLTTKAKVLSHGDDYVNRVITAKQLSEMYPISVRTIWGYMGEHHFKIKRIGQLADEIGIEALAERLTRTPDDIINKIKRG